MKRKFKRIGNLIRNARVAKGWSQEALNADLILSKSRSAQFVSNIERGICNLPWKHIKKTCQVLDIKEHDVITAMCDDHLDNLQNAVYRNEK